MDRPRRTYSLLILGVWGVLWMLGLLASLRTNPHVVSGVALRLRSGFQFDAIIPWEQIATVRLRRSSGDRKLQFEHTERRASVALQRTTNIEVALREPLVVHILDGRQASVHTIQIYADKPTALITAAQKHLVRIPQAA